MDSAEDRLLRLKDENAMQKKLINEQNDKIRILGTKLTRLTSDLRRRLHASEGANQEATTTTTTTGLDVDALTHQVHELQKRNEKLRTKLHMYTHSALPPRGRFGRRRGSRGGSHQTRGNDPVLGDAKEEEEDHAEEVLERPAKDEQEPGTPDLFSLKQELREKSGRLMQLQTRYEALAASLHTFKENHETVLQHMELLSQQLREERRKVLMLGNDLKDATVVGERVRELNLLVETLQREKTILAKECTRLQSSAFESSEEQVQRMLAEKEAMIIRLQGRIEELEGRIGVQDEELHHLHDRCIAALAERDAVREAAETMGVDMVKMEQDNALLAVKLKLHEGAVDVEVEDLATALALVRARKSATVDELVQQELDDARRKLREQEVHTASLKQRLHDTTKLLEMQERLSKVFKDEVAQLQSKSPSPPTDTSVTITPEMVVVEIGIGAMRLNANVGPDASATTVSVDFFSQDTRTATVSPGRTSSVGLVARYVVARTDALWNHLRDACALVRVTQGTTLLGVGHIPLKQLMGTHAKIVGKEILRASSEDEATTVGLITYVVRLQPLEQKGTNRDLCVRILSCTGLRTTRPSTYVRYTLGSFGEGRTKTVHGTSFPRFDATHHFTLDDTPELLQTLVHQRLCILVMDDVAHTCVGTTEISLAPLVQNDQDVKGEFELVHQGREVGKVQIEVKWGTSSTAIETTRKPWIAPIRRSSSSKQQATRTLAEEHVPPFAYLPPLDYKKTVLIAVSSFRAADWILNDPSTCNIFVAFDFCGEPAEEMETYSFPKAKEIRFQHWKAIPFDNTTPQSRERRELLSECLESTDPLMCEIPFFVVNEPPPDQPDADCTELGMCSMNLRQIVEQESDADNASLQVHDSKGRNCGVLHVRIKVLDVLRGIVSCRDHPRG